MSIQTYYINMTETDMWKSRLLFFLPAIFAFESSLVLFELKTSNLFSRPWCLSLIAYSLFLLLLL